MDEQAVMASVFKERCLALLDQVARTKVPLVITKKGKPVVRVVPIVEQPPASTDRSVTLLSEDDEDYFSTGESWEAESSP